MKASGESLWQLGLVKHGLKLKRGRIPSAFVQDNEYVLDDDDESEKEDEDKGNAENEEEFEILIHSDLPIVIEWDLFKNRIK